MKRIIGLLLVCCLLLGSVPLSYAADGVAIDGTWVILVPSSPTAYETYAAEKLKSGLDETLGADVAVVSAASEHYIAVGSASRADVGDIADNGYRIIAMDGNIHLGGTGRRGLQCGAYRFLEEFCGRKVYTSKLTVIDHAERITVPSDTDIVYEPFFEYTETDWFSPLDAEYSMANGLNGGNYRRLTPEQGGTVDYVGNLFCHTMGYFCETEKYKDSHPEYLALHDGERTTDQPCLTNPDVAVIATGNVLRLLREKHDPSASLQIVSVTQNDNLHHCECENCKAFEAAHGGKHAATMLNFVNQIADAVKEAGYDNVAIDTFAYQYTQAAPENIVPRDNVIVRMCSIYGCFSHPFDTPGCGANETFLKDLKDWAAICDRLYVWDYAAIYSHPIAIFPNFAAIQRNIQIFYENNVKGVYEEGQPNITKCDTEFSELKSYMISKCLQEPYCDLDREIDGFLAAYYGPGSDSIRKIIETYTKHAGSFDGGLWFNYSSWACMRQMSAITVAYVDSLWCRAKKDANAEQVAHIERSELSWRWWKANAAMGEFAYHRFGRGDAKEQLLADLIAADVTILHEGNVEDLSSFDRDLVRYAAPDEWSAGFRTMEHVEKRIRIEKLVEMCPPLFALIGFIMNIKFQQKDIW